MKNAEELLLNCRECGEPIYLAWMEGRQKYWPINPDPDEHGSVGLALREIEGRRPKILGKSYTKAELEELGPIVTQGLRLRTPHFRTCQAPKAVESRRQWLEKMKAKRRR